MFIVWLAANAVLLRACWRLVAIGFPGESAPRRIGHTIVGAWTVIVLVALPLGACGLLRAEAMLAGVCTAALAAELFARRRQRELAHAVPAGSASDVPSASGAGSRTPGIVVAAWGLWLIFWLGNVVRFGLLQFPEDGDSLKYHIPLIDHWLQEGGLGPSGCAIWHFPGNSELLGLWMVAPFSGDFLVGLANLPVACLFALSTVDLARQLRLGRAASQLAGLAAVSNYVVLRQLVDNENDIAVAALFISALAYAFRYARHASGASALWFVASLGLLAGTKYYAPAYCLIAGGVGIIMAFAARGAASAARLAAGACVAMACLAGYWYARNTWETGAPFYPFGFTSETDVLTRMREADTWSSTLLGNGDPEVIRWLAATITASLGPLHLAMAAALLPTTAWLIYSGLTLRGQPDRTCDARARLALAGATLACGLVLGVTPFGAETTPGTLNMLKTAWSPARLGLCFFTLAVLAGLVLLDDLLGVWKESAQTPPRRANGHGRFARPTAWLLANGPWAIILGAACWQLLPTRFRYLPGSRLEALLISLAILPAAAAGWLAIRHCSRAMILAGGATAAVFAGTTAIGTLSSRWHKDFAAHYDAKYSNTSIFTERQSLPEGTETCLLWHLEYPFFGSARQFRVSCPLWVPSERALMAYLAESGASIVVIDDTDSVFNELYSDAGRWVKGDPSHFELVRRYTQFALYRVVK